MLPKIIRTGIHRYKGTGVRKTEMATQYRKAYVPVTLDVDKEGQSSLALSGGTTV